MTIRNIFSNDEAQFIEYYRRFYESYHTHQDVIIYGTGQNGRRVFDYLKASAIRVIAFCDSQARDNDKTFLGLPVLSPQTAVNKKCLIFIASTWHFEIEKILSALNCASFMNVSLLAIARQPPIDNIEEKLAWLRARFDNESTVVLQKICSALTSSEKIQIDTSKYAQYRHPSIILPTTAGIIDGGACRGEIFATFDGEVAGKTFVCFEPEQANYDYIRDNFSTSAVGAAVFVEANGLWNTETLLHFMDNTESGANYNCAIDSNGNTTIKTTTIDNYLKNNPLKIDLIKLDIEGAELEALEGGANTIKMCKPALAICTYHYIDDLWLLAEKIYDLNPDYKFHLGHHENSWFETVLYAV